MVYGPCSSRKLFFSSISFPALFCKQPKPHRNIASHFRFSAQSVSIFTYNGHHTFSTRVSSGSRYSVQSQFLEQMFRRSLILISVGIPPFKHRLIRIDIFAAIDQRSAFSHPVCQKIMISGSIGFMFE